MKMSERPMKYNPAFLSDEELIRSFVVREADLQLIVEALRENTGEIEAAEKGELPQLIVDTDLVGVFHVHSTYSDGVNSIKDMALAAKKRGYK